MKLLRLTKWSYQSVLLIVVPLICILSHILRREAIISNNNLNQFLIILSMFFGDSLSFIFEIISNFLQKSKEYQAKQQSELQNLKMSTTVRFSLYSNKSLKFLFKAKLINYSLILCISIINFFASIGLLYTTAIGGAMSTEFSLKIVSFIVTGSFSKYIFRYSLYKHQIIAIIFVFTGQLIIYFSGNIFTSIDLIYIGINCIVPIYTIIEKWLLEIRFVSPFFIVAWEGIFGFLITLFANYIRSTIECSNAFCKMFPSFSFETGFNVMFSELYYWLLIFNYLLVNVGFGLINKYFNPNHRIVSGTLVSVFSLFYNLFYITNSNGLYYALLSIGSVLIMIGCIIYNEIIIIYICNMHYNTIEEIAHRSKNEVIDKSFNISISLEQTNLNGEELDLILN